MVEPPKADTYFYDETGTFLAKDFLHYIDVEASKVPYDKNVPKRGQLPPYYDEIKFKRAQLVFEKYKVCFLLAKLAGLILLLFYATALRIIILTKKSSTPKTAHVRYRDTLEHVLTWYTSDFKDGSRLWKSINAVKAMHHSANLKASATPNMFTITQRELAAATYGFIGLAISKPEHFGLQDLTADDLEAILHFWRVIGYLLGVDDRYNICRKLLPEAKEVFRMANDHYFKRFMILRLPNSELMQFAAVDGTSRFGFILKPKAFLNFLYDIVFMDRMKYSWIYYDLNISECFNGIVLRLTLKLMRYEWPRNIMNTIVTYYLNSLYKKDSIHNYI